jgi:hypothetical protein
MLPLIIIPCQIFGGAAFTGLALLSGLIAFNRNNTVRTVYFFEPDLNLPLL